MATRISALSLTAAVALIGAALLTVPFIAQTAAQTAAGCVAASIDPGYGVNQTVDPQSCDQAVLASKADGR